MNMNVAYGKGTKKLIQTGKGTFSVVALEPWKFKRAEISSYINQHDGEWFLQAGIETVVTFRTGVYLSASKEYNICVVTNAGIYYMTSTNEEEVLLKHILKANDAVTEGCILGTIIITEKKNTLIEKRD